MPVPANVEALAEVRSLGGGGGGARDLPLAGFWRPFFALERMGVTLSYILGLTRFRRGRKSGSEFGDSTTTDLGGVIVSAWPLAGDSSLLGELGSLFMRLAGILAGDFSGLRLI